MSHSFFCNFKEEEISEITPHLKIFLGIPMAFKWQLWHPNLVLDISDRSGDPIIGFLWPICTVFS